MFLKATFISALLFASKGIHSNESPLNPHPESALEHLEKIFVFFCGSSETKQILIDAMKSDFSKKQIQVVDGKEMIKGKADPSPDHTGYPLLFITLDTYESQCPFGCLFYAVKELVEVPFNHNKVLADIWSDKYIFSLKDGIQKPLSEAAEDLNRHFIEEYERGHQKNAPALQVVFF